MSENQNIEYKQSWHDDYLKWVCGFANAIGGMIYIGIDDKGNVVHLPDYTKLMEDIPNKIRNSMGNHRTYMGAHIQLRVYDDKLSIWNEGVLPFGLTLKELKGEHNSRPRNPKIAKACFMAGYIDTWGRGTLKIYNSCKEYGLPEPAILEKDGGFMVALYKTEQVTGEDGQNGLVDGLVDRLVDGLVESQQKIIKLIQSNPNILIAEMANQIGISKTAIDKNLKILKSKKIIRRVGNSKTGHWEILRNKK